MILAVLEDNFFGRRAEEVFLPFILFALFAVIRSRAG